MSTQLLQPNLTVSNPGPLPWLPATPLAGSLDLHLEIDGALWSADPGGPDDDGATYIRSDSYNGHARFRFENLGTPDAGKKWANFRLRIWTRKALTSANDTRLAVSLFADSSIGQLDTSFWSLTDGGDILEWHEQQSDWGTLKSFDYSQAQLDAIEVEFHYTPPEGFYQGEIDISGFSLEFQDAFIEVATGGTKAGGSAISSVQTFLEVGEGGSLVGGSTGIVGTSTVTPSGGVAAGVCTSGGNTLQNGLIHHWNLNEFEAATRVDDVGSWDLSGTNTTHGTGFFNNNGLIGQDGTSTGASLAFTPNETLNDVSISLWAKNAASFNAPSPQFRYFDFRDTFGTVTDIFSGGVSRVSSRGIGGHYVRSITPYDWSDWHLIVWTRDATTGETKISVDGGEFGTNTEGPTGPMSFDSLTICHHVAVGGHKPSIDDVSIWDRVLTQDEIISLYDNGSGLEGSSFGPQCGVSLPSVVTTPETSSGILVGGKSVPTQVYDPITVSGGVVVGGDFPIAETGNGGFDVAGEAGVRVSYSYNAVNEEADIQVGGSGSPRIIFTMPAGGEVVVDGVAEVIVAYKYNASGGINVEGNASGSAGRKTSKEFTFSVRTAQSITAPFSFNWNTGAIPLSHFRIVSKCLPEDEECQPISDPNDGCLRHAVVTLTASTPADVCRQLSERGFRFPIVGFDRFTRPAQNDQLATDTASGDFDNCNTLVPVEFCEIPDCLEFCVDFDFLLLIKPTFSFDFTKVNSYLGDGVLAVSGTADTNFAINNTIVTETVSGGMLLGGKAAVVTPFNSYVASGGITVEGTIGGAELKSTAYQATSGICPIETIPAFFSAVEQRGVGGTWVDDNRIFASDDVKSYASASENDLTKELVGLNASIKVPAGKAIEGIVVEIEKSAGGSIFDGEVALVGPNGIKSDNRAKPDLWPLTDEFILYGSGNDSWGRDWTVDEVNSEEFGVSVKADSISSTPQNALVDSIRISVAVCEGDGSGKFSIGGSATQRSSHYAFTASGGISVQGGLSTLAEYAYEATGGLDVSGSYGISLGAGVVGTPEVGQMEIGGSLSPLDFKSSVYAYDNFGGATGGMTTSGEFEDLNVISSAWTWIAEESGVTIAGSADFAVGYNYTADDTPILITGGFGRHFFYEGNGTIRMGPETEYAVTPEFSVLAFSYGATGDGVTIGDSGALIRFADLGTFEVGVAANFKFAELNAIFGSVDVGETAVPVDTILTSCGRGCIDLPLTIDMNHNLNQDNKLSQFLFRNNFSMSSVIPLNYNKPNDAWQANLHFNGVSSVGDKESWNIVFELQCSSFVSGVELGQSMLRFGVSIIQKNLITGEDYDTRVMSIFDPLSVCQRDSELIFRLTIDSKLKSTIVLPESTVQDTIVHDNIGLFKTGFWFENPEILFNVSEVGTELPARFIDVTPFVNY